MKKYKLIKKYPGSPELGSEFKFDDKGNQTPSMLSSTDIINYPEFWQEIVEKDYEILYILGTDNKIIPYLTKTECINYLIQSGFKIHSVKRLFDDEIFTAGDKTNNGTISKFEIDSNGIRVFFEEKPKNYHVSLNSIKHVKQPLFTTEDGVDIFEGDEFYFISKTFNNLKCSVENYARNGYWKNNDMKTFSTKEAAEEYILMNKPKYSLNDILASIPKNKDNLKVVKEIIENIKNM